MAKIDSSRGPEAMATLGARQGLIRIESASSRLQAKQLKKKQAGKTISVLMWAIMASLLTQMASTAECTFWWQSPTINTLREVQASFKPTITSSTEPDFDAFEIQIPSKYALPVVTNTEMQTVSVSPSQIQDSGYTATGSWTSTPTTATTYIRVANLKKSGLTADSFLKYSFTFQLKGTGYEQTYDVSEFTCTTYTGGVSGTVVNQAVAPNVLVESGNTVTTQTIGIGTTYGTLSLSTANPTTGQASTTLTISYTTVQPWLDQSWIVFTVPKANRAYNTGQNAGGAVSIITDALKNSATFTIAGSTLTINTASTVYTQGSDYAADTWAFTFTSITPITSAGQAIVITIPITNPGLIGNLLEDWTLNIKTQQGATGTSYPTDASRVEVATSPLTSGLQMTTIKQTASGNSAAITGSNDGTGVSSATYQFTLSNTNMVPKEASLIINVPNGVTVPSAGSMSNACTVGCGAAGTFTWNSGTRELTLSSAFTNFVAGTNDSPGTITFTVTGFTNPTDTNAYAFTISTYYSTYGIETFSGMSITATEGACYVQYANVTDGDTRIYAQPSSYTFQMWCSHAIDTTMGIRLVFPSDYIIMSRSSCTFTGHASRYYCQTYSSTNTLWVREFAAATIASQTLFTFSIDSIINPSTKDTTGAIQIYITDSSGTNQDEGTYTFDAGYFTTGNITVFTVSPESTAVGNYPVKYSFNVVPNGDVTRYGYLQIDLPDEVTIVNDRDFEDSCGEDILHFTNTAISCVVTNNGRSIQIKDGFLYAASTNLTDTDNLYYPPDLQFTLDGFQNPRVAGYTGSWNVTIYDEWDKTLYYWDQTDSPTIRVSGVANPRYIEPFYENKINGAFSYLELLVDTTGGLTGGDKIIVKLPFGWQWSADSEVVGRSKNLANVMESTISLDQRSIEITAELAITQQRLLAGEDETFLEGRQLQGKIESGHGFQFRVTNMKNFYALRPSTTSIEYYVYSEAGILFEEKVSGMEMVNTQVGQLVSTKNGILPGDFRTDFEANYTLTVEVANFEKNMQFILYLPAEIDFGTADPVCLGLSGVDNEVLRCNTNRQEKSLTFTNAMQFVNGNPGTMVVLIENLRNPLENVITSSFRIKTQTFDGYAMDELLDSLTVNFYCEYPCAECPQGAPSTCSSCYQTAVERYFHEGKCLGECPEKMVETDDLLCTNCLSPCVTCEGTPTTCTSCIEGYYVVDDFCREEVTWYFPFVGLALAFFILISISEIATKRVSNFKESLIAFWSIPEVLSWGCVIWFMWHRIGQSEATALAALAALMYICINCVHALIHPRYMVPNTLPSYKQILHEYKCGSSIARGISYVISFKFSLILVSYFFNSPRLRGDYSAMNWKQFNRFSLAFCIFPYACMMASCIYFIMTDGFWSYPGFVASEVVFLSSIIQMLLAIDAISAIKCKTVGKRKTIDKIKVATGADYESDDDELELKKKVNKANKAVRTNQGKNMDEFGVGDSEYDSEEDSVAELTRGKKLRSEHSQRSALSQQTQLMNEEARKQIAMLEELAHQMREEKRQLQLDKERMEREKLRLDADRAQSQHEMEAFEADYQRKANALSSQVRDMERQKIDLVTSVEERLSEGTRANMLLAAKVAEANERNSRKNFRDFEGEMEDYEPVEEENSEEAQSSQAEIVEDAAQLPVLPAFGQIDYYRSVDGGDQQWMQQITPRAGEEFPDQASIEAEEETYMPKDATAHFEEISIPPTRHEQQVEKGAVEAEYEVMDSAREVSQNEEYHARSDAEMEVDSEVEERVIEQTYFMPERPIYSRVQDRNNEEYRTVMVANVSSPVQGYMPKPPTLHGTAQEFFDPIEAKVGEGEKADEMVGPTLHYFKQEPPQYGEINDHEEQVRNATAQHFFNPEAAIQGEGDDLARSGLATPQEYISRERHVYGDDVSGIEDGDVKEANEERLFQNEAAFRDDVTQNRSQLGSEMIYQARDEAFAADDQSDMRQKLGSEQAYFEKEDALYAQDRSVGGKDATGQEFFAIDEAVRGDVSSQDRSVAATQQNYFQAEQPELGRVDSYARFKSDGQDFIAKSDLGGLSDNAPQGLATPHGDLEGDQEDYVNKENAEFGRQTPIEGKDATQQEFFQQEKNPEFGRGEQFTRNAEQEQEYNAAPIEDSSGLSESSEGEIANHQPFNSSMIPKSRELHIASPEHVKQYFQGNPNAKKFEEDQQNLQRDMPEAQEILSPKQHRNSNQPNMQAGLPHMQAAPPGSRAKTILYSDKSETSVEDLMDDTPSNYNIQNGRFEGKSLGLKAMLLHAKNYQHQTLDPNATGTTPMGMMPVIPEQTRSPQHAGPGRSMAAPGMLGAQKGIIGSQNDERRFLSNLHQTNQSIGDHSSSNQWRAGGPLNAGRVPVVGDDSSANQSPHRNTSKYVRTNKQFTEDPRGSNAAGRGRANGRPPVHGGHSPNQTNNRDAPKVTKNNFLGGSIN